MPITGALNVVSLNFEPIIFPLSPYHRIPYICNVELDNIPLAPFQTIFSADVDPAAGVKISAFCILIKVILFNITLSALIMNALATLLPFIVCPLPSITNVLLSVIPFL